MPPQLRLHDLRHSCAAILIELGAHPKSIQERLGHSSITLTMDVYGHLFPSLDEALTGRSDGVSVTPSAWRPPSLRSLTNPSPWPAVLRDLDATAPDGSAPLVVRAQVALSPWRPSRS